MKINHHPDDATLLAFAAGALNEGFALVIAAHMEQCTRCRDSMAEAEALGGELMAALPAVEMNKSSFDSTWQRIQTTPREPAHERLTRPPAGTMPSALSAYMDGGLESIRWRMLVPGIQQHILTDIGCGNGSVRLFSIAPGTNIPHHSHEGSELALILRGSYTDKFGSFKRGDLADLDESAEHQPVADSDEPCVCLIATDEKLRFSGLFSRMLQPLVGI